MRNRDMEDGLFRSRSQAGDDYSPPQIGPWDADEHCGSRHTASRLVSLFYYNEHPYMCLTCNEL